MAISSCWLHSPKGQSLGTVHDTKAFFSLSGQGFTSSLCSPILVLSVLCWRGAPVSVPGCSCSSARATSPLGCPSGRFSKSSPAYMSTNPAKDLLAPEDFCTIPLPGLLMGGLFHLALHPKVHPETSLILLGAQELCRVSKSAFGGVRVALSHWKSDEWKERGESKGRMGMCRPAQEIMCHAGSFPLAEVFP